MGHGMGSTHPYTASTSKPNQQYTVWKAAHPSQLLTWCNFVNVISERRERGESEACYVERLMFIDYTSVVATDNHITSHSH